MKTAIQQGLEQLQAEIDIWESQTPTPVRGALIRAREIFKALLPTERQIIEDAYKSAVDDGIIEWYKTGSAYFEQTFNDKTENNATN